MRLAVAFCTDAGMEVPLHAAASSLLAHATTGIDFYFVLRGFNEARRNLLLRSLDLSRKNYGAVFLQEPDAGKFSGLRPFHGNLTPYYRLALPDIVPADRLLYVDSDTVTALDVAPLAELSMHHASGFVPYGVTNDCLERSFFADLGLPPDTTAFNSGVMLFDLAAWRRDGVGDSVLAFCRRYQEFDQTALIAVCAGEFHELDSRYNVHLYTNTRAADLPSAEGLFHFVGSPKPWDIGGRYFHRSYTVYSKALADTVFKDASESYASAAAWKRAYRVRGGYARRVLARFKDRG